MRPTVLDAFPRLGWVDAPTPVTALPDLADVLGLAWLGVKRDDRLPTLHGGSKVRKLDFALAAPTVARAPTWTSFGAIGSGHLSTLTAAATHLERRLLARCFFEPLGPWVEEELAFTASGPTELRYYASRARLALRHPLELAGHGPGVIPPGVSNAAGTIGMVRAGLELAAQLDAGELPHIDRVYVPLGSGGTVAGLAIGLALGGYRPSVHAVAAVERIFARAGRVRALIRRAREALRASGIDGSAEPAPFVIDHRMVGRGYGHATPAALREVSALGPHGVELEPVYGGKAMAALRADAAAAPGARVLFWSTGHRRPLPRAEDWEARLPRRLQEDLRTAREGGLGRRRWIGAGVATAAGLALGARAGLHSRVAGWEGHVLFEWEGAVLAAAAAAIVPEMAGGPIPGGVPADAIAVNVDRYLVGMPSGTRAEIHGLVALVEHGTALDGQLLRFTRLDPAARRRAVAALAQRGGDLGQAAKGLRDLVYLGYYQDPRAWPHLGYGGPWVRAAPGAPGPYDALRAPPGTPP
ncbi:MAG: pyridoxal-phosphate dependent enzyme [Sandaracinaceae bacterium]